MGEILSYTKGAIDQFILAAEVVGPDLVLTKGNGETITVALGVGEGATFGYVDDAVADAVAALMGGATPEALNTLNELAAAFGDNPNAITDILTQLTAVKSGAMGVVIHGATASVARPAGYGAIHWIGTVSPTNAIDNDVWTDTSA